MKITGNINTLLRNRVNSKWPTDEQKEWWYTKQGEVRRKKLLRCSEQQNHRCCYCGVKTWHSSFGETGPKKQTATLEHVISRSNGGTDSMNNLAMACSGCNNQRGDHYEAIEYYEMVVGLRPSRKANTVYDNIERRKEREAKRRQRQEQIIVTAAITVHGLGVSNWWNSWLTHGETLLEQE